MSNTSEMPSWDGFFSVFREDKKLATWFWTQTSPKSKTLSLSGTKWNLEPFQLLPPELQSDVLRAYEAWEAKLGPQDDDELHDLIQRKYGLDVPREAVCKDLGHCAPFTFLADAYFERERAMIAMANRGGAKTALAALWIHLSAKFKAGCEGASVATEEQVNRAYNHLKGYLSVDKEAGDDVADEPQTKRVRYRNGSLYELIIATLKGTSGPHPSKVHTDEADHMDPEVFENSRNMAASKPGQRAQNVITSTRYRGAGLMQKIWTECDEAIKKGYAPPHKRYQWCIFECMKQVPNCMIANPNLPEGQHCGCDKIVKGEWESGEPRRFSDVCGGRAARGAGWFDKEDVWQKFMENDRRTWETQQECIKPSSEGLMIPEFDETRQGIRVWHPNPEYGPVYGSVDFGGTAPHAVVLIQVLKQDVLAHGFHQGSDEDPAILLLKGSRIIFDEIYKAEIAPSKLADLVIERTAYWKSYFPTFRVSRFFYDVQAKGARLEWAAHQPPIFLCNFATKDVELHVSYIRDLIEDNKFFVNVVRCPMFVQEIEAWRRANSKPGQIDPAKPVKDFDHAVDATRYGIANIRVIERKGQMGATAAGGSGAGDSGQTAAGPSKYRDLPPSPGRPTVIEDDRAPMFPRPPDAR